MKGEPKQTEALAGPVFDGFNFNVVEHKSIVMKAFG